MTSILSGFLRFRQKNFFSLLSKRFSINPDFSGDEEILENYIGNIKLIGINLIDTKNILTESALDKLINSFKNFYSNDEHVVAILHGCGGNFCTGVVRTDEALKKCEEIIEVLSNREKPIIASLKGHVFDVGFQMAVMSDLRVVEEFTILGLKSQTGETKVPDLVYRKLLSTVGITQMAILHLTNMQWSSNNSMCNGFANLVTPCGCSLGQAIVLAQSIGLKSLSEVVETKKTLDSWENKLWRP